MLHSCRFCVQGGSETVSVWCFVMSTLIWSQPPRTCVYYCAFFPTQTYGGTRTLLWLCSLLHADIEDTAQWPHSTMIPMRRIHCEMLSRFKVSHGLPPLRGRATVNYVIFFSSLDSVRAWYEIVCLFFASTRVFNFGFPFADRTEL